MSSSCAGPSRRCAGRRSRPTVVDAARRLGVRQAATLGGIPALVSHRKAAVVTASATQRSLAQESVPLRPDYAGPTGLQTVILRALGDVGHPRRAAVGPGSAVRRRARRRRPRSARCWRRLVELYHLDLDLRALDERSQAYLRRVEAGLAARPDVKEVVDQIDQRQEGTTGDLVAEIEQFLRSQSDDDPT